MITRLFPALCLSILLLIVPLSASAQVTDPEGGGRVEAAEAQVLLDRVKFSPGSIDNTWGSDTGRTRSALRAFQTHYDIPATGRLDRRTWATLIRAAGVESAWIEYQITDEDTSGPYAAHIPSSWIERAEMEGLYYTSVEEMLAERFHLSPGYLRRLNPDSSFTAGETIVVPNVEPLTPLKDTKAFHTEGEGAEIVVSGSAQTLTVFGDDGRSLYHAPITPGSSELPLPSGTLEIRAFDIDPEYLYNPEVIRGGDSDKILKLPPGPNNPVGILWIALTKPRYGIHGTPEPEKIGYSTSHGCVRLTNWDAAAVGRLVKQGTIVHFTD